MWRKAYNQLIKWKLSATRKPLLLLGARQVGKTWLMKEFGKREFSNYVYINCDAEPLAKSLFETDYDIQRMLVGFQAISGEEIREGTTLIILDEIQEAPRGLHSLKYFQENAPGYHIIAAGSLLGVTLAQHESFPVGKVNMLRIYPMDFEEFLWAIGEEQLCRMLCLHDHSLEATFADKLSDLMLQYYFVGGMPEVVVNYITNRNLNECRSLQQDILTAYRNDISKHTSKVESNRIRMVIDSLPSQLAKENKKFIYGVAKPGARASDFETAIQWLIDAGIVYKVPRVSKVALPLKFYEDFSAFKLFILDIGLLGCLAGVEATSVLINSESFVEYKGMLAEQYVAQQLTVAGMTLYYWSNDRTPAEIDFVIEQQGNVLPIEVKASTNVRGRSISLFVKNNPGKRGVRFSLLPYRQQEWLTNYPLYLLPFYF